MIAALGLDAVIDIVLPCDVVIRRSPAPPPWCKPATRTS
jgi:hypothetical protein